MDWHTFWQIIEINELACVGDYAYYEVTIPLPQYPQITCLLQNVTALANGTPVNVLCIAFCSCVSVCSVLSELQNE